MYKGRQSLPVAQLAWRDDPVQADCYIDDAGTPGARSKSAFLSPLRRSWCAVIVPWRAAGPLGVAVDLLLGGVRQDYGAEELHFAEIYGGRGVWEGVSVDRRIEVFDLTTEIFVRFGMPVIFQTVSESIFSDHAAFFSRYRSKLGQFWKVESIPHNGLLLTCYQFAKYFRYLNREYPTDFPSPLPGYVDEGLARAGAEVDLPNWGDAIEDKKLMFRRSVDVPGLQLADFAAFTISRTQWLAVKQQRGKSIRPPDLHIMGLSGRLNVFNLVIDPGSFSGEDYDDLLMKDREKKRSAEVAAS